MSKKFLLTEQDMDRVWALAAARIAGPAPQSPMPQIASRSISTGAAFYRSLTDYIIISEQLGQTRELTDTRDGKEATIQVRPAETGSGMVYEINWKPVD